MGFLGALLNLGGFLNGSKTYLGLLSLGYYAVSLFKPEVLPTVDTVLQVVGVTLLPIGIADKVRKTNGSN